MSVESDEEFRDFMPGRWPAMARLITRPSP